MKRKTIKYITKMLSIIHPIPVDMLPAMQNLMHTYEKYTQIKGFLIQPLISMRKRFKRSISTRHRIAGSLKLCIPATYMLRGKNIIRFISQYITVLFSTLKLTLPYLSYAPLNRQVAANNPSIISYFFGL